MLEECGLPYNVHKINIGTNKEQFTPEYLKINPNGKIPSIVDPDGPGGKPIAMMESGDAPSERRVTSVRTDAGVATRYGASDFSSRSIRCGRWAAPSALHAARARAAGRPKDSSSD